MSLLRRLLRPKPKATVTVRTPAQYLASRTCGAGMVRVELPARPKIRRPGSLPPASTGRGHFLGSPPPGTAPGDAG